MADATLLAIRTKVRRLTRSLSPSQISDNEINEYINTFCLYDFPENLRAFALRRDFSFWSKPNIEVYDTATTDVNDPLYNFRNKYITTHEPVYVNGSQIKCIQDQQSFNSLYPSIQYNQIVTVGDGLTTHYTGTLYSTPTPIARSSVFFSSVDANNTAIISPDDGNGHLTGQGNGTINYLTGAYDITFTATPASGANVYVTSRPYTAGMPLSLFYFGEKFYLRPIPDKSYQISFQVYVRPTELLQDASVPFLEQWWQYIAYGAAKKIFEDRFDNDSVQAILPEFKQQELLVNRTTLVQKTKQRVPTIFSLMNVYR